MAAEVLPFDEFRMQICKVCRESLPLDRFSLWTEKRSGRTYRRRACKGCLSERAMAWASANLDRVLDTRLRREFGITLEQYNELEARQGGLCAICGRPPAILHTTIHGRRQGRQLRPKLVVDHDHLTGKIRGLLCTPCNSGIGLLGDDPAIVRAALSYLKGADQDRQ